MQAACVLDESKIEMVLLEQAADKRFKAPPLSWMAELGEMATR